MRRRGCVRLSLKSDVGAVRVNLFLISAHELVSFQPTYVFSGGGGGELFDFNHNTFVFHVFMNAPAATHTCMHTCTHAHTHTCTHTHTHTHTHARMQASIPIVHLFKVEPFKSLILGGNND